MRITALVRAMRCALGVLALGAAAQAAAQPVLWTRDELERAGYVRLADFLQRLPLASVERNALYNGGGSGTELVDLRQLGARYTLVLVDGRRWPAGDDGAVDLSAISWSSIERVEIDRAPSVARYGSGAVAGVVNIVTRRALRGAEARAWHGAYVDGDGRSTLVAARPRSRGRAPAPGRIRRARRRARRTCVRRPRRACRCSASAAMPSRPAPRRPRRSGASGSSRLSAARRSR